jgi:hypothetical protein
MWHCAAQGVSWISLAKEMYKHALDESIDVRLEFWEFFFTNMLSMRAFTWDQSEKKRFRTSSQREHRLNIQLKKKKAEPILKESVDVRFNSKTSENQLMRRIRGHRQWSTYITRCIPASAKLVGVAGKGA